MSAVVEYVTYLYNIPHNFSANSSRKLLDAYPDYPLYAGVLYLLMVFYLPGYLKRRHKVYPLKFLVASWNLFLSLASFVGAYYTDTLVYDFVYHDRGFHKTCCEVLQFPDGSQFGVNIKDLSRRGAHDASARQLQQPSAATRAGSDIANRGIYGASAFYVTLFMYLKTPELLDTLFLILQGKPVSFLHWFHHILTAVYCWHASYALIPSGLFFVAMNYTVHAVMYFYYFLVVLGLRKKIRWFAPFITLMQVSQMVAGMMVTVYTYFQHWLGPAHKEELFYAFFNAVFSGVHLLRAQLSSLVRSGTFLARGDVPSFDMSSSFHGCETDTTNLRMGMCMYGAYCVLFVTLFRELYISPSKRGSSLVLARKEADATAAEVSPSSTARTTEKGDKSVKRTASALLEEAESSASAEGRRKKRG